MDAQVNVVIFSTPTCSFCNSAKRYFKEKNVKFKDIDVSKDITSAREMIRLTGQTEVPVILINNKPIIGFDRQKINQTLGINN